MMLGMRTGGKTVLIPNPRDIPAVLKELRNHTFHSFPAVNTLFNALLNHPDFDTVNWRNLRVSLGGGMAVQAAVAKRWLERTGCPICEGYGLSETSPSVCCNPVTAKTFSGTIGVPIPGTEVKCLDDEGREVPVGTPGEIAIRGPQVMAGYWQRPEETARVMTADGFFRTGDIGVMDERGYFKIVDRKKDMILVSGFNVYPNEVEDVVAQMEGVLECAAVGIPDEHSGEAVKLVVVRKDPALTEAHIREYCAANLTGYKRPKVIEFRSELPKTPVGKILRRELRGTPQPPANPQRLKSRHGPHRRHQRRRRGTVGDPAPDARRTQGAGRRPHVLAGPPAGGTRWWRCSAASARWPAPPPRRCCTSVSARSTCCSPAWPAGWRRGRRWATWWWARTTCSTT